MGGTMARPAAGKSCWQSGTIENGRRVCFGHHQRKNIFNIANKPALRGWLVCFFTGRAAAANSIFMHSPVSAFFVEMCLERPAGRDKHENKNNISAKYAQSAAEGI